MLRSLWLLAVYLAFIGLGVTAPFVMTLGYVWVDTFRPQEVAYSILSEFPVALIMGAGALVSYLALDRRSPPPLTLQTSLHVMFVFWMAASLAWAEVPGRAWDKWDWAGKAVGFAAFVPFVIRSRVQIEAFVQTFVFSLAANFIPFGLKVIISGGGYGQNLGLLSGNSGLAEGGYLSTACLMAVPLTLYLGKHGMLIPRLPLMQLAYMGVAGLAVITAVGTYERSALVGLVVLGIYMFMRSRRKILYGAVGIVGMTIAAYIMADSWTNRISTIAQYNVESSSLTRILIWEWTLNYVAQHPFGGGFQVFLISSIVMPPDEANPGGYIQFGRAFHSIYFEVLGELGWPGLVMFLLISVSLLLSLRRLTKKCRKNPDLVWVADLSDAIQTGMLVFLSAGAFVGIAFQPPFGYFVSMGVCLRAYVWRSEHTQDKAIGGWRQAVAANSGASAVDPGGWRKPPILPGEDPIRAGGWRRPEKAGRIP